MTRRIRSSTVILFGLCLLAASSKAILAREPAPAAQGEDASALAPGQLDQLTAPIALYPDPMLAQILTAATYPLEIVLAQRWLDAPSHATLSGDALTAALQKEDWDTSVKALVSVPEVLRMMSDHLEWTEDLGNAFLEQQADVMDSIQRLRQHAAAFGALQSTPQASVSSEENDVVIEPVSPDVIYVPCYTPAVYGPWPWPLYPPYYFPWPTGFCYGGGPYITFGIGFGIYGPFWSWYRWHWPGHVLYRVGPSGPSRPWRFDPGHRREVPYRDAATAQRFSGQGAQPWRAYRGFPAAQGHLPPTRAAPTAPRAPARQGLAAPRTSRPAPPAFESYGPGSRARTESSRGASSRGTPSAPSGRGGGFGGRTGGGGGGGHRR